MHLRCSLVWPIGRRRNGQLAIGTPRPAARPAAAAAGAAVPRGAWLVWGLAASFYFVALFHRMSLGVASLEATHRFGVGTGALAAFSAVQLGLYLLMQVPAGLGADRIGPRRMLAVGLACMAVGEVTFGLSTSMALGLAGRALVGIGDAFTFLNVLRLADSWFPVGRYALVAGLTGLAGALGQIVTTIPLGIALGGLGWSGTFVGTGVLTALLVVLCLAVLRDRPAGPDGDGRQRPPARHEGILRTLRLAAAQPGTRHGFWVHFGLMGPFVTMTALWGYPYLVRGQGLAPGEARAWLLVTVAVYALGSPAIGLLAARRPERRPAVLAGVAAALAACWALTLLWPGERPPGALAFAAFTLTGLAGAAALLAFDLAREGGPVHRAGSASGLVNTGGFLAAVAAEIAIGLLLAQHGAGARFGAALWPMVVLIAVAAGRLWSLARHPVPRRACAAAD
jgi:MFS family permease